jgi:hypothetical protein
MEARVARFRQLVPTHDGVAAADVIGEIDVAATDGLVTLACPLRRRGVGLQFAGMTGLVTDSLARFGLE